MESKNRKADRKARRRLAALLLAGTLSSMPCVAFSAPTEVSDASGLLTALKTSQSDGILLKSTGEGGTGITLSSTLTVGMTNKVDLGGVALNQNGQKIGFSALGETLTITDSKPGEKGSALNFTSFEFDGSLHPGTVVLDGVGNQFSNGLAIQGLNVTLNNGSFAEVVGDMNVKGSSNLKILGGSGISVVKKQPETEGGTATGGNLTLTLNGGRSVMVDSADSDYRSTFTVDGKTTLSAIGESSVQALNGSGVDLGEVTLTVDAGSVMIFRADGKGTLNVGNADGTTSKQEIGSLMVMDRFTQNGTGNVLLYVQNGAELSVGGDLTLDDNTFFIKDEDAEAGAGLYVGGTLTVNQPSLVIGADSSADLEAVGANILKVAESDNTDVALTVMDKKSLTFGQVYGAQGKNSALNLTLVGGSGLHAITDEKAGKDWTGVMQLGSENSGAVNITMTEKSAIWAGKSLETTLHDGSMISLDGGSSIDAQESNSVYAASGTSYLDISGASLMYSEGTLSVRTAENANMEIFVEGISEKENEQSFFSSVGDFTLGGKGTLNLQAENHVVMGSTGNMVVGDSAEGTVNFSIKGNNSYIYVTEPKKNDSNDKNDGKDDGKVETQAEVNAGVLTIAKSGTVNMEIADSARVMAKNDLILAENADAEASITLENKAQLVSETGSVIIGKAGAAEVTGSGDILSGKKLVVGQKENALGSVDLVNGTVNVAGLVVGEEEGAAGTFSLSGKEAALYVWASEEKLEAAGNGVINLSGLNDVTDEKFTSGVYLDKGAQIHANDGINLDNTYLQVSSDTLISAKNGGMNVSNGSTLDATWGTVNVTGDVNIQDSTLIVGIGSNGAGNKLSVTDGSLTIENGTLDVKLVNVAYLGEEWVIAEVNSEDEDDQISGEWNVTSELEIYDFAQEIIEDGKKQVITMDLNNDYFNVRANSMQLARQSLWNTVDDRINWNVDHVAYCGQKSPFFNYDERSSFWMKSGYRGTNVDGKNGYDIDAFNVTIGADCAFEEYFAAGAFFSFSNPEMAEDHESVGANNYSFGFYGGYKTWGDFELKAMMAYTLSDYSMHRYMGGEIGNADSEFRGSTLTASVEIARPFYFGNFVIRPLFAVDTECVWQEDATETGYYSMYYEKNNDAWTYARLGGKMEFTPTERLILRGKAFYALQLDDDGASETSGRLIGTDRNMQLVGADIGDDYFNFGISAAYMFSQRFSAFADYDGYFADDSDSHVIHGGFQVNF